MIERTETDKARFSADMQRIADQEQRRVSAAYYRAVEIARRLPLKELEELRDYCVSLHNDRVREEME